MLGWRFLIYFSSIYDPWREYNYICLRMCVCKKMHSRDVKINVCIKQTWSLVFFLFQFILQSNVSGISIFKACMACVGHGRQTTQNLIFVVVKRLNSDLFWCSFLCWLFLGWKKLGSVHNLSLFWCVSILPMAIKWNECLWAEIV